MTGLATVIIVASIASAGAGTRAENVRLHVGGLGDVVGTRNAGAIVDEFRGIPFAHPPIGKLRWRPPVPIRPWTGVRAHAHMLFDGARQPFPRSDRCLLLRFLSESLERMCEKLKTENYCVHTFCHTYPSTLFAPPHVHSTAHV
jgi:hypothetical protein